MDAGLFGGTFNPLHNGHLGIAGHVKQAFDLDKIFFFPSSTPPHKPRTGLAPARDRYEMVVRSLSGMDGLAPSDIELKRKGPSFTVDTITAFILHYGIAHRFYLLMGSDAFFDTPSWRRKEAIFEMVPVIVMLRGEARPVSDFSSFIDEKIAKGYTWESGRHRFTHNRLKDICICHVPRIDISSTMVRNQVKQNRSITDLVPPPVAEIIRKKDLYK